MMLEAIVFLILIIVVSIIFNYYFFIRTAASLFLAVLVSAVVCFLIFQSDFAEIALNFAFLIGVVYGVFRAVRDKRDV